MTEKHSETEIDVAYIIYYSFFVRTLNVSNRNNTFAPPELIKECPLFREYGGDFYNPQEVRAFLLDIAPRDSRADIEQRMNMADTLFAEHKQDVKEFN